MSAKYRSSHELTGREKFYVNIAPVITGVGAAVVILGALFKIMHWPGAAPMLIVGLGTEAILFLLFAFAPPITEPDWTLVYPQLAEDEDDEDHVALDEKPSGANLTKKLDQMMSDANISPEVFSKLGNGFKSLADSVSNMSNLSNATVASDEYAKNVKAAAKSLQDMNKSYAVTIEAMSEMSKASTDAKEYHSQVQYITKNLAALNAVYEMELQDANNHLKAMNKFYGNLSSAMENMSQASGEAQTFKTEMGKLTGNLTSLNTVYGNMLAAMKA